MRVPALAAWSPSPLSKLDKDLAGLLVGQRFLAIESRYDDQAGRSERAGGGQDLFHAADGLFANRRVVGDEPSFEAGADRTDLNRSASQRLLDHFDPVGEPSTAQFKSHETKFFHVVEFLIQVATRHDPFLARQLELCGARRFDRHSGGTRRASRRCEGYPRPAAAAAVPRNVRRRIVIVLISFPSIEQGFIAAARFAKQGHWSGGLATGCSVCLRPVAMTPNSATEVHGLPRTSELATRRM